MIVAKNNPPESLGTPNWPTSMPGAGLLIFDRPFRLANSTCLSDFRVFLDEHGYTQSALIEIARIKDIGKRLDLSATLLRTETPTPYNSLVRLFLLGQWLPIEETRSALTSFHLEQLIEIGLLTRVDGAVRSEAVLVRFEDLVIAHDFGLDIRGGVLADNHVLGVGGASITLANLTPREKVDTVLDLGTGSGIQALLASRHAHTVIGVDTNLRALNFAALNLQLNGVHNVELREGYLYEPVKDLQFDLIVANPPFVISPQYRYAYRDSGLEGDAISEQTIRGSTSVLREGGYAVVLCNWHHETAKGWPERPFCWLAGSQCDAWIIRFETGDPVTYASTWLHSSETVSGEDYEQCLASWVDYLAQNKMNLISAGGVIMRRRTGSNWVRADSLPSGERIGSCSDQVQRIFANQDILERLHDGAELLKQKYSLAPDARLKQSLSPDSAGWKLESQQLALDQGFVFSCELDWALSSILARCNGCRSLEDIAAQFAREIQVDEVDLLDDLVKVIRELLKFGFLIPSQCIDMEPLELPKQALQRDQ